MVVLIPCEVLDLVEVLWYNIGRGDNMKEIQGLPNYHITEDGKVYSSVRGLRELKTRMNDKGYLDIKLLGKNYRVHRLVAQAFIPNPNSLPQVNHIDGDKLNNYASNLEWCDNARNQQHAWDNSLQPKRHAVNCIFTQEQANAIRAEYLQTDTSQRQLAAKYSVAKTTIADLLNGKYYNLDKIIKPLVKNKSEKRLTQEQADDIRKLFNEQTISYNALGKMYGVDHKTIKKITDGLTYVQ